MKPFEVAGNCHPATPHKEVKIMGDRIVVSFTDGTETSPALYAHWHGLGLLRKLGAFIAEYKDTVRNEPSNLMVNFVVYLRHEPEDGGLYLYPTAEKAASPDDNGYWELNVNTWEIKKTENGSFDSSDYDVGDVF